MELFTLLRGRSKSRLKPVMVDEKHKIENRQRELQASDPTTGKTWHYDIVPAAADAQRWRLRGNGTWKNYDLSNPPLVVRDSRR